MNLNRLNIWLSFLANVGVMIGLIVVVIEIRESNRQATSAANIARYGEIESSFREFSLSEHLPKIYVLIDESGVAALNPEQFSRVQSWERARIVRMEGQFVQFHDGYLPESGYQNMLKAARKRTSLWKELRIHSFNTAFHDAISGNNDV